MPNNWHSLDYRYGGGDTFVHANDIDLVWLIFTRTRLTMMIRIISLVVMIIITISSQSFFCTRKESRKLWLTYSCSGVGWQFTKKNYENNQRNYGGTLRQKERKIRKIRKRRATATATAGFIFFSPQGDDQTTIYNPPACNSNICISNQVSCNSR